MKTFTRRRSSSIGDPAAGGKAPRKSLSPQAPAGPSSSRVFADWATLPDGVLLQLIQELPHADRPRCRLVCKGWAAAAGAAIQRADLSLSPLPREASRQLAAAYRRFPSTSHLTLRFPNFLLPAPSTAKPAAAPNAAHAAGQQPSPAHAPTSFRRYVAPLLGVGVVPR
ncbi:hypothetical protein Agub_g6865, partial [Astrephomene gubernaculifera]